MATEQVTAVKIAGQQRRAMGPIGTAARIGLALFVAFASYQGPCSRDSLVASNEVAASRQQTGNPCCEAL